MLGRKAECPRYGDVENDKKKSGSGTKLCNSDWLLDKEEAVMDYPDFILLGRIVDPLISSVMIRSPAEKFKDIQDVDVNNPDEFVHIRSLKIQR